jgi:hypothetical protein
MRKLKATEVAGIRSAQLVAQGGKCALCGLPLTPTNARLDHDHSTGAVRGTLHNGCNALLGKVENNAARFGLKSIPAFGHGLGAYIAKHQTNITGLIHPTHKTEEEKRLARNAKARKARATKKGTA